jgi:D-arabinose 1-dehydrogenase-like Zn-dependent alcohol dehydrogenase
MGAATYRACQAVGGGKLEFVDRPVEEPAAGMVRVAVEACGICHSDALTVEGGFPGLNYPRVPGHEAVGRIDALGAGVTRWQPGQRVGVGFLAGRCGECSSCRRGDFVNCFNQAITGIHLDGGYAQMMVASQHALVAIPDALLSVDAAPLQCAGVTTFNALRKSAAKPGELVAIQGVGGLAIWRCSSPITWASAPRRSRGARAKRTSRCRLARTTMSTAQRRIPRPRCANWGVRA